MPARSRTPFWRTLKCALCVYLCSHAGTGWRPRFSKRLLRLSLLQEDSYGARLYGEQGSEHRSYFPGGALIEITCSVNLQDALVICVATHTRTQQCLTSMIKWHAVTPWNWWREVSTELTCVPWALLVWSPGIAVTVLPESFCGRDLAFGQLDSNGGANWQNWLVLIPSSEDDLWMSMNLTWVHTLNRQNSGSVHI